MCLKRPLHLIITAEKAAAYVTDRDTIRSAGATAGQLARSLAAAVRSAQTATAATALANAAASLEKIRQSLALADADLAALQATVAFPPHPEEPAKPASRRTHTDEGRAA